MFEGMVWCSGVCVITSWPPVAMELADLHYLGCWYCYVCVMVIFSGCWLCSFTTCDFQKTSKTGMWCWWMLLWQLVQQPWWPFVFSWTMMYQKRIFIFFHLSWLNLVCVWSCIWHTRLVATNILLVTRALVLRIIIVDRIIVDKDHNEHNYIDLPNTHESCWSETWHGHREAQYTALPK